METILKIDKDGQLSLPQSVLDALHVAPPCEVRVETKNGRIEIETVRPPAPEAVLIDKDGLLVVANTGPVNAVELIRQMREDRINDILR